MATQQELDTAADTLLSNMDQQGVLQLLEKKRQERITAQELAARPQLGLNIGAVIANRLCTHAVRPEDATDQIAPDQACLLVRDAIKVGDAMEVIFALVRLYRVVWRQMPHLGPLQ